MNFDKNIFQENLKKNKNIKNIVQLNNNIFKITTKDEVIINIIISQDNIHKFYTSMEKPNNRWHYYENISMPHDSYQSLYKEIDRITNSTKRSTLCEYPYFKS